MSAALSDGFAAGDVAPAHDAWMPLATPVFAQVGTLLLVLGATVGLLGSPLARDLLDAPDAHASVFADAERSIVAAGLAPGWWPGFDDGPFFEPLPAVHLIDPPTVTAGGRTVFDPSRPLAQPVVRVRETYVDHDTGRAVTPRQIRVGDHVDVTYTVTSLTPETLRDVTILDPQFGPAALERPLQPRDEATISRPDLVVPPRVVLDEVPRLLLGTDPLGRDLAARLAAGAWRLWLVVGGAALLALLLGGGTGWLAARTGRPVVTALGRARIVLVTFPFLLVTLVIVSLTGARTSVLVLLTAAVSVPITGRRVRDAAVGVSRSGEVEAAIASGRTRRDIARRIIAPRVARIAVSTALGVGVAAAIVETSLGFLGLVPPAPAVSLGAMVADVRWVLDSSPGYLVLPGLVIVVTTLGGVLVGEGVTRGARLSRSGAGGRGGST